MEEERSARLLEIWQEDGDLDALDELLRVQLLELKRILAGSRAPLGPASRDDLAQEAVVRLLGASPTPRFASPSAMRGYLLRIGRNLLVDRLRRASRAFQPLEPSDEEGLARDPATAGSLDRIEREDLRPALEIAINLLSPEDQGVLRLVYFRGLSVEETAAELGLERGAANMRLVRARVRLAERLRAWRDILG